MDTLQQLNGVDVSGYNAILLNKQAFQQVDFTLYPPLRMHFLIHAIQFQHRLPSQASMLRSERRNLKKSGEQEANQKVSRAPRINNPKRLKRAFVVPKKHGPKPFKRARRNRAPMNFRMPFAFSSSSIPMLGVPGTMHTRLPTTMPVGLPGTMPTGLPGTMPTGLAGSMPVGLPGTMPTGLPGTIPTGSMPAGMPGAIPAGFMGSLPIGLPRVGMPIGIPPFAMGPLMGRPLGPPPGFSSIPFMPASHSSFIPVFPENQLNEAAVKKRKAPRNKNTVFKVRSPEQIALKSARTVCREEAQKWRKEQKSIEISEKVNKQVPLYFQKKKASQKRRRQEKHQLIKKNRKRLVQIYGDAVFRRGWPISRKQIKQALGIKDQVENQVQLEGISQLMQEQQVEEKVEVSSQANTQVTEVVSNSEDKLKLVLLIEQNNASSSSMVVPQYVLTG